MAYKWETAHEWLLNKALIWDEDDLFHAITLIAPKLDADDIQDMFQEEMDEDGYFDEVDQ